MTDKLDWSYSSLETCRKHDWSDFTFSSLFHIVNEYLIRKGIIEDSHQVYISIVIVVETVSCEISYMEVNMRNISWFSTINFVRIRNSSASSKVSCIIIVLCVEIKLSFIDRIILLLSQEGIFKDTWSFIPKQSSLILLQNIVHWRTGIFVINNSPCNVRT